MNQLYNPEAANQGSSELAIRQSREIEKPVTCDECGSTWFTEMVFNQYSDMAYGSSAGADIRTISVTQQTLRVCLCGRPYSPNISGGGRGRAASADLQSFNLSLKLAQDHRTSIKNAALKAAFPGMDTLATVFAGIGEIEQAQAELATLKRDLENLQVQKSLPEPAAEETTEEAPASTEETQEASTETQTAKPAEKPAAHAGTKAKAKK